MLNVKQILQDSMVGFFKLDLGVVYAQPNHCYGQKWLVLVDTRQSGSSTKVRQQRLFGAYYLIVQHLCHN